MEMKMNEFTGKTKEEILEMIAPKMAAMHGKPCVKKYAGDVYDVDPENCRGVLIDMLSWIAAPEGEDHYKDEPGILKEQIRGSAYCWIFDELGVSQELYEAGFINNGMEVPS